MGRVYAELLGLGAKIIHATPAALELAEAYQAHRILSSRFYNDGLHIALATIAEADVLVSWNFRHIVRLDKIRLFNAVNMEFGFKPVQIYSPREVTLYDRTEIDAVQMTRQIRDAIAEQLQGLSQAERLQYYQEQERLLRAEAEELLKASKEMPTRA